MTWKTTLFSKKKKKKKKKKREKKTKKEYFKISSCAAGVFNNDFEIIFSRSL